MEGCSGRGGSSLEILGPYKFTKTLGFGESGKVKLAVHTTTGLKVAIKILKCRALSSVEADKARKEINIMRQLFHPHIVRLYEVIYTQSYVYLVMEYMESGDLHDYLTERGKLHEDNARCLFQQIIAGLEYCHNRRVVHRDLKPENLLMDTEHNIKIADFGFGNIMQDGHFLKTCCGSPNYAAPELLHGRLYAGPEVDVWSCGIILYALLCARLPFHDDSIPRLYSKIKHGVYPLPKQLSESARDLISRILVVDPMKRISIPEIRRHPWFQKDLQLYMAVPSLNAFNKDKTGCLDDAEISTRSVIPEVSNWTLGFKSLASPCETLSNVLKVFHCLNVKWKRIGHYNMKCLWLPTLSIYSASAADVCVRSRDAVKFEIQLYKAIGELYVLDLQLLSGSPLLFLNLCAAFRALILFGLNRVGFWCMDDSRYESVGGIVSDTVLGQNPQCNEPFYCPMFLRFLGSLPSVSALEQSPSSQLNSGFKIAIWDGLIVVNVITDQPNPNR